MGLEGAVGSCARDVERHGAMVTLLVTYLNLGLRADFVVQWVKAYFIAWPVAAVTGFRSCSPPGA